MLRTLSQNEIYVIRFWVFSVVWNISEFYIKILSLSQMNGFNLYYSFIDSLMLLCHYDWVCNNVRCNKQDAFHENKSQGEYINVIYYEGH